MEITKIDYEFIGNYLVESKVLTEAELGKLYVDSSNIKAIWFTPVKGMGIGVLSIEFLSDAIYEYYRVPESLYLRFMRAPSYGKFMWKHIRGRFPYQRVDNLKGRKGRIKMANKELMVEPKPRVRISGNAKPRVRV